jgi:HIV-1 Vpr-binding protein
MEQGYRFAREAVRSNNGIKVLLHLLHPRTVLPPTALDCIRALACRVLLGLARDDTIAHILTKLQACTLCFFLHAQTLHSAAFLWFSTTDGI